MRNVTPHVGVARGGGGVYAELLESLNVTLGENISVGARRGPVGGLVLVLDRGGGGACVVRARVLKTIIQLRGTMLLGQLPVAASGRVVVLPVLVSHLSSRFAAAVLPPLLEAGVPVRPDDAVVQPRAVDEAHGVLGPCARVVLDEAEATGRLLDFVQADDDALHVSAFRKYVVDLVLGGIKGEISNIQSVALLQQLLLIIAVTLTTQTKGVISISTASELLHLQVKLHLSSRVI